MNKDIPLCFTGKRNYKSPWYKKATNLRAQIIARCTDEKHPIYSSYGGRGVTVCERWLSSLDLFLIDIVDIDGWDYEAWVIGEIQLDKDAKGSKLYSKDTCTWLSNKENNALGNGTSFIAVDPNGVEHQFKSAIECANYLGVSYDTISKRRVGLTKNPVLSNGWVIPLQQANTKANSRRIVLPITIKNVYTKEELSFHSIAEVVEYTKVGVKIVRDAINPSKPHTLVKNKYLIKDAQTHYKKGYTYYYTICNDDTYAVYTSIRELCNAYNLNITCVSECLSGKQNTHKGYTFKKIKVEF